jgi:WD40 repeat protein
MGPQDVLAGHGGRVLCVESAWHGDGLLSGGADSTLKLWDLASNGGGKCLLTMNGHMGWVTKVKYWGRNTMISASTDRSIGLWDVRSGSLPLFVLQHHKAPVSDLYLDASWMVSAGADESVATWDFRMLSSLNQQTSQGTVGGVTGNNNSSDRARSPISGGNGPNANTATTTTTSPSNGGVVGDTSCAKTRIVRDPKCIMTTTTMMSSKGNGTASLKGLNQYCSGPVLLRKGIGTNGRKPWETVLSANVNGCVKEWDSMSGELVHNVTTSQSHSQNKHSQNQHLNSISCFESFCAEDWIRMGTQTHHRGKEEGFVRGGGGGGTITASFDGTVRLREFSSSPSCIL